MNRQETIHTGREFEAATRESWLLKPMLPAYCWL
jgi:hypothetical protein